MVTRAVEAARASRRDTPIRQDSASRIGSTGATIAVLTAWTSVIVIAHVLLERLQASGANIRIDAAPLFGVFDFRPSVLLAPAVAGGAAVTVAGPRIARRAGWKTLVLTAMMAAAAWAVSLALVDGWHGLNGPLEFRAEYLADVPRVGSPGLFLSTFVDHIRDYGVHVQGHPPGMLLLFWCLDRIGLGGSGWAAVLCIGGGVAAVPAVLVTVREVAGEVWARRAAPFVAVAPAAIWIATTADAFYAGVAAWAVALLVLATSRRGIRSSGCALAGGVLFGITAFLSYGLVLLAVVPALVVWRRRRTELLVIAVAGALAVSLGFLAAGFSWIEGLAATRNRYFAGVGSRRPYIDFLVANAAAFGIVLGPAIVVALARLRDRRLLLLVGAGLLALGLAMISGMSKGEVERIWLPFAVWLLPAGAVLAVGRDRVTSGWLGVQIATTIAVTTLVKTPW